MNGFFAGLTRTLFLFMGLCLLPMDAYAVSVPVEESKAAVVPFRPDRAYQDDAHLLDQLQRDAFRFIWEDGCPVSGMAYESSEWKGDSPIAVGGTGFGVATIVVAVDRGWITREQAVVRLQTITHFLRDKTPRRLLHGAFPHWLDGKTGEIVPFGKNDAGADIVETALLMQGLLIARSYFDGPGVEADLRAVITELWEDVDWQWFTSEDEVGLYWHWNPNTGFLHSLRILGYNECLIAYVLAMASPTHPISRKHYDYWTSGKGYQPKSLFGYTVEASLAGGGPLFLAQYSFIGLDPRQMADAFVPGGYFARNVKQTLSNRSYCLFSAPAKNRYSADFWGLTASRIKSGYTANSPTRDTGTVAPTAALTSMPYTPHYSLQVLANVAGPLRETAWGKNGPYDALSLREKWTSNLFLAIDQLPIVSMVENYRTGLLWRLLMRDKDIRAGLLASGIVAPSLEEGFPEAVVTVVRNGKDYVPDAYDIRRHPDLGLYQIPYWVDVAGDAQFSLATVEGEVIYSKTEAALAGRNVLQFPQVAPPNDAVLFLTMSLKGRTYSLPVRLH